jgi:hypothetical protein
MLLRFTAAVKKIASANSDAVDIPVNSDGISSHPITPNSHQPRGGKTL